MDPIEFYHQASRWFADAADQSSVTARSIVSRAYYAALLTARDKAGIKTQQLTHEVTVRSYRGGSPANRIIGNKLDQLRSMRTLADYDLMKTCVRREAGSALKRSADILYHLGVSVS